MPEITFTARELLRQIHDNDCLPMVARKPFNIDNADADALLAEGLIAIRLDEYGTAKDRPPVRWLEVTDRGRTELGIT